MCFVGTGLFHQRGGFCGKQVCDLPEFQSNGRCVKSTLQMAVVSDKSKWELTDVDESCMDSVNLVSTSVGAGVWRKKRVENDQAKIDWEAELEREPWALSDMDPSNVGSTYVGKMAEAPASAWLWRSSNRLSKDPVKVDWEAELERESWALSDMDPSNGGSVYNTNGSATVGAVNRMMKVRAKTSDASVLWRMTDMDESNMNAEEMTMELFGNWENVDTDCSSFGRVALHSQQDVVVTPKIRISPRLVATRDVWSMCDFDESRAEQFDWDDTAVGGWTVPVDWDPSSSAPHTEKVPSKTVPQVASLSAWNSKSSVDRLLSSLVNMAFASKRVLIERCSGSTAKCVIVASVVVESQDECSTLVFGRDVQSLQAMADDLPEGHEMLLVTDDMYMQLQNLSRLQFAAPVSTSPRERARVPRVVRSPLVEGEGI